MQERQLGGTSQTTCWVRCSSGSCCLDGCRQSALPSHLPPSCSPALCPCVPPVWQAERTPAANSFRTPYQDEVEGAQHIHEEFTPLICEEGILQALVYLGVYLLQPGRKFTGPSATPGKHLQHQESVPVSENLGDVPKHNAGQQDRVGRAVQGKALILEHKPAMSLLQ